MGGLQGPAGPRGGPGGAGVVDTARARRATLVVLDGFRSMRGFLPDDQAARVPLFAGREARVARRHAAGAGGGRRDRPHPGPGAVGLRRDPLPAPHRVRRWAPAPGGGAQVRGGPAGGPAPFAITADGLYVYPRLDRWYRCGRRPASTARAAFGIEELDRILGGGLQRGDRHAGGGHARRRQDAAGPAPAGGGRGGASRGSSPASRKSAAQLRQKARTFGLGLEAAEAAQQLRAAHRPARSGRRPRGVADAGADRGPQRAAPGHQLGHGARGRRRPRGADVHHWRPTCAAGTSPPT